MLSDQKTSTTFLKKHFKLGSWSNKDFSTLQVLKMYFVSGKVLKRNITDLICNVLFCHSARDKIDFKDLYR